MVLEKVKKSDVTITGIVLSLILVIGLFSIMFLYFQGQGNNEGMIVDSKYNDTYNRLSTSQSQISNNINTIQDNFGNVSEADNTFQVAWNGLKGLGNILTLPIRFLGNSVDVITAIFIPLDVIPPIVLTLIKMGIIVVIVLVLLAALTGGNPKT